MDQSKLTGLDYMTKDLTELQGHKDFSPHALRIMQAIGKMSSKQIEQIKLVKDT